MQFISVMHTRTQAGHAWILLELDLYAWVHLEGSESKPIGIPRTLESNMCLQLLYNSDWLNFFEVPFVCRFCRPRTWLMQSNRLTRCTLKFSLGERHKENPDFPDNGEIDLKISASAGALGRNGSRSFSSIIIINHTRVSFSLLSALLLPSSTMKVLSASLSVSCGGLSKSLQPFP